MKGVLGPLVTIISVATMAWLRVDLNASLIELESNLEAVVGLVFAIAGSVLGIYGRVTAKEPAGGIVRK